MGISGLLPLLKDVTEQSHLSNYKGKVLGVDAYVWLHRGAYGCAEALATGRHTDAYVKYAMTKVKMLQHYGVTPYVVFDGDRLPAKAKTEDERQKRRAESLAKAHQLVEQGDRAGAREQYVRCVDVTPAMAYQLIKSLRAEGIQYIVAPYEADAQLAYLERRGVIDGIVSEDSDLLVFGCKTVLYKLRDDGCCDEITYDRRRKCKALPLHAFGDDKFRQMAILSGCDYLPSLPKMGVKTACEMLRRYSTVAQILAVIVSRGIIVPPDYKAAFERAERTFVYQRVFDRTADGQFRLTTLTSLGMEGDETTFDDCIGPLIDESEVNAMANGDLDPISRRPIEDLAARKSETFSTSRASFYSQTRPRWMAKRKGSNNSSQAALLPGQKKIEGFFSTQPATAAAPRKALTVVKAPQNVQIASTNTQRPAQKSPFFIPCAPKVESPKKIYEGNAVLATFSTPPTQRFGRKRQNSEGCSDDGLISSPPNSAIALDRTLLLLRDSPQSDVLDDGASSPITSPTMRPSHAHNFAANKADLRDADADVNHFDRFRFDATSSKAIRTPLSNIENKVIHHAESDSSVLTVKTTFSSANKRSLQVDEDPFSTPCLNRAQSMTTPTTLRATNGRLSFYTPNDENANTSKQRRRLHFD